MIPKSSPPARLTPSANTEIRKCALNGAVSLAAIDPNGWSDPSERVITIAGMRRFLSSVGARLPDEGLLD